MTSLFRRRVVSMSLLALLVAANLHANGKAANVPPTMEIAILDPNVDPLGNPAVKTKPGPFGQMEVDIPPTVLVHRYYYSGDRSFQAQFLPGGPSIVVVSHPKTGERLYIPVQMIPGAPRVKYTHSSIEYDYGNRGINIEFCWLTGKPSVEYRQGKTVSRVAHESWQSVNTASKNFAARSGIADAQAKIVNCVKSVSGAAVDRFHDAGQIIIQPVVAAGQFIPGINLLSSTPEDRAQRIRDSEIRRAAEKNARKDYSIPAFP